MGHLPKAWTLFLCLVFTGLIYVVAAEKNAADQRDQAKKLFADGNYKDALEIFRQLALDSRQTGENVASDLEQAVNCLAQLQHQEEIDNLLAQAIANHADDYKVYWKGADLLASAPHYGFIVAGEFSRGNQRGGGAYVDVTQRDRVQSLIWMDQARQKIPADATASIKGHFYLDFANRLIQSYEAWKLQDLTDLTTLPAYPESSPRYGRGWRGGNRGQGAPVDEVGNPILYSVPESFEKADSDGQRWRWCLQQASEFDPAQKPVTQLLFADFLHSQFGVQTLRQWGILLPDANDQNQDGGIWSLPSLGESETIARLATGVKRFPLPDEFNYIKIYQDVSRSASTSSAEQALGHLAEIFSNRQQYSRAAEMWRESIQRFADSHGAKAQQLKQIVGNWGQFEPVKDAPAGTGASVEYRFRNGDSVAFKAQKIKVAELIADVRKYLESAPRQLDWQKMQVDNIGYRIVQENEAKYLGETVAEWSLKLDPRPDHFDRRITVTTPLQAGGAYLVTATMKDGNVSRIVLWLNDLAIIKKPLDGKMMYFVADAVTGKPSNHAHVEFFGWKQEYQEKSKNYRLLTQKFAEFTNADGMIVVDGRRMNREYQWLATARSDAGGFAHLGFSHLWFGQRYDEKYDETKVYIVTDRPVYRPDQKVQFKFWIRQAKYDNPQNNRFAGRKFVVKINDPQGTEVFQREYTTDDFGGLAGEYVLPKEAGLGSYTVYLDPQENINGANQFRVEEYKKPEFEVTIDAPEKPVQLGEKITAVIKAKYYYGAPVTQGRVKYKVERKSHESRWFPIDRWDWLYGNGYWWFSPDYSWYPGFGRWGCLRPIPSWGNWRDDAPELVLDQEVEIGADGTVKVEIDTALAKVLHGDEDHEYSITAEVTDASRRTIVGGGQVLVSREPYKIYAWTDRGYYRVGDTIEASFQARTLDGSGVTGDGKLQLFKITYPEGKPVEQLAQTFELKTDAEGRAKQTIKASEAGQYRLSFKMQTAPDAPVIEGGQLFVIRGEGFDGSQFKFNDLELIADKKHYAPGEKVQLMVNTNRVGSTVLLFVRPTNGIAKGPPQVLLLQGKSTQVDLEVSLQDMPNFFVEAITIRDGDVYDQIQELMVPPEQRILNVEIRPSAERYLPGQKADVQVKVTDPQGKPYVGSVVLSVYDRAVEYISGGSNVEDIKKFFWSWQRSHYPQSENNLSQWFNELLKNGEMGMQNLGVFGDQVADADKSERKDERRQAGADRLQGRVLESQNMRGAVPLAASAPAPMADGAAASFGGFAKQAGGAGAGAEMVQPTVRTNFADTAFWKGDLKTDGDGMASVTFDMPENLSGWKIRAWSMGSGTNVGEDAKEVVTAKNLVVRLQAPRFFVEKDEVVLSAVVHNYLKTEKSVQTELQLEGDTLQLMEGGSATTTVTIAANGEHRVDWRVKAVNAGTARVTMKALTDEESDAMQMNFPVIVHGILKTESFSGVIRPEANSGKIEFTVPEDRQPLQSRLEVHYSPTLAGAMVDALPYLAAYPYGCTEQTLNRFVPTVITQRILQKMGLDLKAIQTKRTNLNAQELGDPAERAAQWKRFASNPVFDADEVAAMVKQGVQDLTAMQNSDGGWGWFSGFGEHSYPHTTAVVVHGLQIAVKNDIALVEGVLENGISWLKRYQSQQIALLEEGERHEMEPNRKDNYKSQCDDLDALVFSVLVDGKVNSDEMQRFLYRDRNKLSLYSQALLGLALHQLGAIEQRDMVVRNIDQFIQVDSENQTAYLDLPNDNSWWYWYGNQVEANAHYLKLLTQVNVNDPKAAGLVKYLVNNRKHGSYWSSTRDTAYCIEALADYLVASGESKPNMAVEVWLDGQLKQTVEITPEVLFSFENSFVLEGDAISAGKHTLELKRKSLSADPSSLSPVYFNAYVTNFTTEEFITATGLEIKVARRFYRLVQDKTATHAVSGGRGQVVDQKVLKYQREELKSLDKVTSGDLIEIELEIESKNDYEYVIFEDMKAAGCEPVDLQSGYTQGGLGAYVEFRDERVAFFLRQLQRGKHSVSYRVRAEIPGKFSALPTNAHAMYAPELQANADEMKLRITDLPEKE